MLLKPLSRGTAPRTSHSVGLQLSEGLEHFSKHLNEESLRAQCLQERTLPALRRASGGPGATGTTRQHWEREGLAERHGTAREERGSGRGKEDQHRWPVLSSLVVSFILTTSFVILPIPNLHTRKLRLRKGNKFSKVLEEGGGGSRTCLGLALGYQCLQTNLDRPPGCQMLNATRK